MRGPATPIPKQWKKLIANSQNKTNLSAFLTSTWRQLGQGMLEGGEELVIGGGFTDCNQVVTVKRGIAVGLCIEELQSDQEEADTQLLLHAKHASLSNNRVIFQSPDTDLAVICTSLFSHLGCRELCFRTCVKDKLR